MEIVRAIRRRLVRPDPASDDNGESQSLFDQSDLYEVLTADVADLPEEKYAGPAPNAESPSKTKLWLRWLSWYMPVIFWVPNYKRENLPGDIIAGLSVSAMIIPQGLAYASLAGLPPIYGLYTALVPLLVYSLFGHSRQLAIGPEALVALLVGSVVAQEHGLKVVINETVILTMLVGSFLLLLGGLRFGFLQNVMSAPILSGFVSAVVFTIAFEQVDTLAGEPPAHEHSFYKLAYVWDHWKESNGIAILLSVSSITLLVFFRIAKAYYGTGRLWLKLFPEPLLVVALGILASFLFDLEEKGVRVVGHVKPGLPTPALPDFSSVDNLWELSETAMVLSIVGFVESMVVAREYAHEYHYPMSANRELVALGAANLVGSFFQCIPTFGSLGRSKINANAGANTQLAGIVTSLVVLFAIVALTPVFYYLPLSVMASLIIVAVLGLLVTELKEISFLYRIHAWQDLFMMTVAFAITLGLGIETGLILCVGASLLLVIKLTTMPMVAIYGQMPDKSFRDITVFSEATMLPGVLVAKVVEPYLYFANIGQLCEILDRLENLGSTQVHPSERSAKARVLPKLRMVILESSNVRRFDSSAMHGLHALVESYVHRNVGMIFVGLRQECRKKFLRSGIVDMLGSHCFMSRLTDAVAYTLGDQKRSVSSYQDARIEENPVPRQLAVDSDSNASPAPTPAAIARSVDGGRHPRTSTLRDMQPEAASRSIDVTRFSEHTVMAHSGPATPLSKFTNSTDRLMWEAEGGDEEEEDRGKGEASDKWMTVQDYDDDE